MLCQTLQGEGGLRPRVIYGHNGHCCFYHSGRGHPELRAVRSARGDAAACACLGLEWGHLCPASRCLRCGGTTEQLWMGVSGLKLEKPKKGKKEDIEGRQSGSTLLLQARDNLRLQVQKALSS